MPLQASFYKRHAERKAWWGGGGGGREEEETSRTSFEKASETFM